MALMQLFQTGYRLVRGERLNELVNRVNGVLALYMADGTAALPGLAFKSDTDVGFYHIAANNFGASVNGAKVLDVSTTGLGVVGAILTGDGTVALPGFAFTSDPDTGFYHIAANNIGIGVNGAKVLDIGTTGLSVTGALSATTTITATTNLIATGYIQRSVGTGLTAVGTTVADALQLAKAINNITTVAANTAGVILPLAATVGVGGIVYVYNNGANAMHVYGAGADTIDGQAAATGVTLTNAKRCIYTVTAAATYISAQLGVVSA